MRAQLRSASERQEYGAAVDYGKQLVDSGSAEADDLLVIAHAYDALNDCPNAVMWLDRANEALHAAQQPPDESLHRIKVHCRAGSDHRVVFSAAQTERAGRLLRSFTGRAEADRGNLPQLEADAERSTTGEAYVRLGELYFGFAAYEKAVAAIQRGLEKGQVTHLEDAYVYLGRSESALDHVEEARKAFAKLKEVPNISPRVLYLWQLYAETYL
jgi:tetratricopeptide (TPR) repeat protein